MSQVVPPKFDPLFEAAREITNDEQGALGPEWIRAVVAGDVAAATRISESGFLAEHYGALINTPGRTPTPDELDTLSALRIEAKRQRDHSNYGT